MLTSPEKRILLNELSATTLQIVTGVSITIEGYAPFNPLDVVSCDQQCSATCTAQVDTITVVVPDSCECPWTWEMKIEYLPRLTSYRTQETFYDSKIYTYTDPNGAVPVNTDIVTAIVNDINNDPYSQVTAADSGGGVFTITENDCDTDDGTRGFNTYVNSGTIANTQAHIAGVLSYAEMFKLFPIKPGSFGSMQTLPNNSTYCAYYFEINEQGQKRDIDMADVPVHNRREVIFYVDNTLATYAADWETDIVAEALANMGDCLA